MTGGEREGDGEEGKGGPTKGGPTRAKGSMCVLHRQAWRVMAQDGGRHHAKGMPMHNDEDNT